MITSVLSSMLIDSLEIPYISHYRKDHWEIHDLFIEHTDRPSRFYLWVIYDLDEKWFKFSQEKEKLKKSFSYFPEV